MLKLTTKKWTWLKWKWKKKKKNSPNSIILFDPTICLQRWYCFHELNCWEESRWCYQLCRQLASNSLSDSEIFLPWSHFHLPSLGHLSNLKGVSPSGWNAWAEIQSQWQLRLSPARTSKYFQSAPEWHPPAAPGSSSSSGTTCSTAAPKQTDTWWWAGCRLIRSSVKQKTMSYTIKPTKNKNKSMGCLFSCWLHLEQRLLTREEGSNKGYSKRKINEETIIILMEYSVCCCNFVCILSTGDTGHWRGHDF